MGLFFVDADTGREDVADLVADQSVIAVVFLLEKLRLVGQTIQLQCPLVPGTFPLVV